MAPLAEQPGSALRQQQPGQGQQQHRTCRHQVKHPPGLSRRPALQGAGRHSCPQQGAQGLEAEGCQHQPATQDRREALREHQMGRGVVGTEGHTGQHQPRQQPARAGAEPHQQQGCDQDQHLPHEQRFSAEPIGQGPQQQGSQQNAQQGGRAHESLRPGAECESFRHQREGDAPAEDDQPFEQFAGTGQGPQQPLHPRNRARLDEGFKALGLRCHRRN